MIFRKLFYRIPASWRFIARRIYHLPEDAIDSLTKKKHTNPTPPKGMIYTGGGDFEEAGLRFVRLLEELTHLNEKSKFLDIGSGIGRLALPLTKVIKKEGSYDGFDVVKKGVDWCQKNITSRFEHFNFKYIPLKNDLYNSQGDDASTFEFPYHENNFSHVVLMSIFTHFQKEEVQHYLKEILPIGLMGFASMSRFQ